MLKMFFILLFPQLLLAVPYVSQDPYKVQLPRATHELEVRLFQHGLKGRESLIADQIRFAEMALSQCAGVVLKITPLRYQNLKASTIQEKMIEFRGSNMFYAKNFLKFMKTFVFGRSYGQLDLPMTEYMSKEILQTQMLTGQLNFGQAFNLTSVNTIFKDPRAIDDRQPALELLTGNTLFLAIDTLALQQKSVYKYAQFDRYPRGASLLAHEIGHLLFEGYDPATNFYGDHWCPEFNTSCERGYLMSSGGNFDAVYKEKISGKILGFDPFPKLDRVQCERLRNSKYLQQI